MKYLIDFHIIMQTCRDHAYKFINQSLKKKHLRLILCPLICFKKIRYLFRIAVLWELLNLISAEAWKETLVLLILLFFFCMYAVETKTKYAFAIVETSSCSDSAMVNCQNEKSISFTMCTQHTTLFVSFHCIPNVSIACSHIHILVVVSVQWYVLIRITVKKHM